MFGPNDIHGIIMTFVYSAIGMVVFGAFFVAVVKLAPFSVIKEIEEDQNTSLAILIGSIVIGLSIIIAAAII